MQFQKAVKSAAKLRLAMTGPSGSGKTYSALRIASGIGKRIALIDTENHSAALYADSFDFDTISLMPPYTLDKYMDSMKAAVEAKYDVLVVDSISHAWAGEGGLLEKKGAMDVRGGNSYTNWAPITKEHEQFKSLLLTCDIHLIVTMRSKQDYIMEMSDKGKSVPRKVGLAPIQREGMEYEFTMVLDMAMDHNATVSKTRVSKFDGKLFQPSKETGIELLAWLNDGPVSVKPLPAPAKEPLPPAPLLQEHIDEPQQQQAEPEPTVTFEAATMIAGMTDMLMKMNGGDTDVVDAHFKSLSTWSPKGSSEKRFLKLDDMPGLAQRNPKWFNNIYKKVVDEYQKAMSAK